MNNAVKTWPRTADANFIVDTLVECNNRAEQEDYLEDLCCAIRDAGYLHFNSLDDYLLFRLDGSEKQVRESFGDIESAAVFENHFEGVIGFDITQLSLPLNSRAADIFIELLGSRNYNSYAVMIFFIRDVEATTSRNLIRKLGNYFNFFDSDLARY